VAEVDALIVALSVQRVLAGKEDIAEDQVIQDQPDLLAQLALLDPQGLLVQLEHQVRDLQGQQDQQDQQAQQDRQEDQQDQQDQQE
jgi:hypothetical protein